VDCQFLVEKVTVVPYVRNLKNCRTSGVHVYLRAAAGGSDGTDCKLYVTHC